VLTSGRLVEYEGGGEETRSNPWLAELQQENFIEINPKDANDRGVRGRRYVWVKSPTGAQIKVKAMVTERVGAGTTFIPFHFLGLVAREGHARVLSGGAAPIVACEAVNTAHDLRLRLRDDDAGNQDDAVPGRQDGVSRQRAQGELRRAIMARMKFLCDAERCIECNGCVTACKQEHDIPWGVNRRRVVTINDGVPGERSISVACMHCSDAPCMAVCPVDCFYRTDDGVVLHDKDLCIGCGYCFYACPFGAPQFPQAGASACAARWTSARSAPAARADNSEASSRSTAAIRSPKASCRRAPRCARPRRCSAATATCSPRSTASA
jgi:Fe-S-cluster-containing dehydrogenase component